MQVMYSCWILFRPAKFWSNWNRLEFNSTKYQNRSKRCEWKSCYGCRVLAFRVASRKCAETLFKRTILSAALHPWTWPSMDYQISSNFSISWSYSRCTLFLTFGISFLSWKLNIILYHYAVVPVFFDIKRWARKSLRVPLER